MPESGKTGTTPGPYHGGAGKRCLTHHPLALLQVSGDPPTDRLGMSGLPGLSAIMEWRADRATGSAMLGRCQTAASLTDGVCADRFDTRPCVCMAAGEPPGWDAPGGRRLSGGVEGFSSLRLVVRCLAVGCFGWFWFGVRGGIPDRCQRTAGTQLFERQFRGRRTIWLSPYHAGPNNPGGPVWHRR